MTDQSLRIVATSVLYYHQSDERAFCEWLDRMPFVREYYGEVRDLFIELSRVPDDKDFWELIGFCRRYGIDTSQLARFLPNEKLSWLQDED